MAKDKLVKIGDELEEVALKISNMEVEFAEQVKPLRDREEELRDEAVKSLVGKGLDMIRTSSGLVFVLVKGRINHKIKKGMESDAIKWAIAEYPGILSIAAGQLNKVVQPMLNPPTFIERTQGNPHLSVKAGEN